ncbi:MAG: hypothetical protein QKV08_gp3 [Sanya nyamivirus 1]|uniref:Uncharacterized protein n=2 Tax=Nyamiviridae TaxID=1513294 RepID=A0A8K1XGF2_9MONO|nr:MAG: hypothetical protein QKV08_gp3 [Sanya nyamivirus 1]UHM27505.1 MAG: hypothetical protein SaNyV1_gp3 [Sanya nyamivirus 1]UHR49722.1 MAG: hypothetical protein FuNyV1_gp4 [Hangzhou Nyamivirus 1]
MEKAKPYSINIILYSIVNPQLEDIPLTLSVGDKKIVSPSLLEAWETASYRLATKGDHRKLYFKLNKKGKRALSRNLEGSPRLEFNLTELSGIPTRQLEFYDSLEIDGSALGRPSAPPAYLDSIQGGNHMSSVPNAEGSLASDEGTRLARLLSNEFYQLSINPDCRE